jgi:hypothetical protein
MIGVHREQPRTRAMIRVSVLYPNSDGVRFDKQYYLNNHLPMPFVAVANLSFDSLDSFQQAFGANAQVILGDIPNYTDIEPVVQIGEIKL